MPPGPVLHGTLPAAGVLLGGGSRVASRSRCSLGVPGGSELTAALSPTSSLQVSAWISQGGTLPQGLLDCEVWRWVKNWHVCRAAGSLEICSVVYGSFCALSV